CLAARDRSRRSACNPPPMPPCLCSGNLFEPNHECGYLLTSANCENHPDSVIRRLLACGIVALRLGTASGLFVLCLQSGQRRFFFLSRFTLRGRVLQVGRKRQLSPIAATLQRSETAGR